VFDLDPGDGIEWRFVVETAFRQREILAAEGDRAIPRAQHCD
jgi:bifunctional non-homologous end joining protein LigD